MGPCHSNNHNGLKVFKKFRNVRLFKFSLIVKRIKLRKELYFIDKKVIKNGKKTFTHSKERVIKMGKIKCPLTSQAWR